MSDGGIYLVKVKKNVLKTIERLEQSAQKRVASVLRSLVFCPRPPGSVSRFKAAPTLGVFALGIYASCTKFMTKSSRSAL